VAAALVDRLKSTCPVTSTTLTCPPLLRDGDLWHSLQHAGCIQMPLLPPSAIDQLLQAFTHFHPTLPACGFVSSTYSPDLRYKQAVSDCITDIVQPYLDSMFQNHRILGAAFLYKMPGPQSALPLHQAWTVVDEDRFIAINAWIPLVDADVDDGTLHVMPGSHRVMRGIRAPTLPFCYSGHEALMQQHMCALPTKAGQAVVINQATANHSPANLRDTVRPAVSVGVVSAPARLRFYYRDRKRNDQRVEMFEPSDDFFLRFDDFHRDIFLRPRIGHAVAELDYPDPARSADAVEALIRQCQRLCPAPRTDASMAMRLASHRPVLTDAAAERALTADGYTILSLISAAEAARLLDRIAEWVAEFPVGFYASVHATDVQRTGVNALLMATFRPLLAAVCRDDVLLLGGAFINKAPGPRGALPPHQDWNIVDESRHRSFNVWVPLVDTHAANGAISVIPGSHRWLPTIRGPNIPCIFRHVHPELHAAMKLLPMRVGQVLIYDHRLLHCSDINSTSDHRPGAVMGLVPAEAELMHYVVDGERIRQYRSNVDFLLSGRTHQGPDDLSPEAWLDHDDTPLRSEQLADFLGAPSWPAHNRKADSP